MNKIYLLGISFPINSGIHPTQPENISSTGSPEFNQKFYSNKTRGKRQFKTGAGNFTGSFVLNYLRSAYKSISFSFLLGSLIFLFGIVPQKSFASLGLNANAVAAANICAGSTAVPIHSFTITSNSSPGTISAVSF